MTLSICVIYPELLGTYGDRGNALVLQHRASKRGFDSEIISVAPGENIPESADIYLCGGGEDNGQKLASEYLREQQQRIESICQNSILLAICAGFQILGKQFPDSSGELCNGLGIIDATTQAGSTRLIGEIIVEPFDKELIKLTGYENHAGRTSLTATDALGKVIKGFGNGVDVDGIYVDGFYNKHIIATYLHGPILARNPQLADVMLAQATNCNVKSLKSIENDPAERLHEERLGGI